MRYAYPQLSKIKNQKLRKLALEFIKEHEQYNLGTEAKNECGYASEKFLKKAATVLKKRKDVGVLAVGRTRLYRKYCGWPKGHYVIRIGRLRIDFTARQFHPRFSFPKVWLVSRAEDSRVFPVGGRDGGEGIFNVTYFST